MPPSIEQYLQELLGAITEGSTLYFRELIELEAEVTRRMYSYHYQGEDASLVFRYDDTPHFPEVDSFPHHKHVGGESRAASSAAPDLRAVLHEIETIFPLRVRLQG